MSARLHVLETVVMLRLELECLDDDAVRANIRQVELRAAVREALAAGYLPTVAYLFDEWTVELEADLSCRVALLETGDPQGSLRRRRSGTGISQAQTSAGAQ